MSGAQSGNDEGGWSLAPYAGDSKPAATAAVGTPATRTSSTTMGGSPPGPFSNPRSPPAILQGPASRRSEAAESGFALASPPPVQRSVLSHSNAAAARDRPPMSVVVVNRDTTSSHNGTPNSRASAPPSCSSAAFSKPFRLQPRRPVGGGTMASRRGGRKRTAHSMSGAMGNPAGLLVATEGEGGGLSCGGSSSSSSSSAGFDTAAALLSGMDTASPASCFPQQHRLGISANQAVTPSAFSARNAGTPPRSAAAAAASATSQHSQQQHRFDLNFQCLSLQSPKPNRQSAVTGSPPATLRDGPGSYSNSGGTNSSSSSLMMRHSLSSSSGAMGMLGSSAGSHPGSAGAAPRSCFTAFAASPVHSAATRKTTETPPPLTNHNSGSGSVMSNASARSSPRLAPLTVIQQGPARAAAAKECSISSIHSNARPPLPNSLWCSLEGSVSSPKSPPEDAFLRPRHVPPKTVHCRKPSSDSISTVHNSVLSPSSRPSPGGFLLLSPMAMTSPNKQARRDVSTTSPGQSAALLAAQTTPRTPRTPLPRVTLTPRSTGSRRSHASQQVAGLPRFPSPSDTDMDVTSPFLHTAATTLQHASKKDEAAVGRLNSSTGRDIPNGDRKVSAMRTLFPESSNSLALSADGSPGGGNRSSHHHEKLPMMDIGDDSHQEDGTKRKSLLPPPRPLDFSGGSFMGIHTKSLLTPSRSNGIIQAMMEEENKKLHQGHSGVADTGSISDIDEDEVFILASPGALETERVASLEPARQRRRCSASSDRPQYMASSSPNTSSNHLFGMNYVTSSTSLFGMDIAHPPGNTSSPEDVAIGSSSAAQDPSAMATSTKRNAETCGSFGGVAEKDNACKESYCLNRRKSDSSFASVGLALEGRDLVTPPIMAPAGTPPPLPCQEGYFMPVESGVEDDATEASRRSRTKTNICVAGADRRSVTTAIAQMAFEAQHHAEKSPVI